MEQEKRSFFNRLKISIKDIDKYDIFAGDTVGKSIVYILKLLAVVILVLSIFYTYQFKTQINNAETYEQFFEGFEIPEDVKEEAIYVLENTPQSQMLLVYFVVTYLTNFMAHFLITISDVILLVLLAYIATMFSRIRFKTNVLFNISCSAITLSVILKTVYMIINMLNGFTIEYFDIMYTSVAFVYVIAAIMIIKTELIKNEQEVMQILIEQERIRKESEEKDEKQTEEKNKDDK